MTLVNSSLVDAFFSTGFEESAEVMLGTGTKTIFGHFYDKHETAKMLDKDIESSSPSFECKTSDVVGAKQKDKFICRGIEFYIHEIKSDGEGFTLLTLYYGND